MHLRNTTPASHRQSTVIHFFKRLISWKFLLFSNRYNICNFLLTSDRVESVASNFIPSWFRLSNLPPTKLWELSHVWARFSSLDEQSFLSLSRLSVTQWGMRHLQRRHFSFCVQYIVRVALFNEADSQTLTRGCANRQKIHTPWAQFCLSEESE